MAKRLSNTSGHPEIGSHRIVWAQTRQQMSQLKYLISSKAPNRLGFYSPIVLRATACLGKTPGPPRLLGQTDSQAPMLSDMPWHTAKEKNNHEKKNIWLMAWCQIMTLFLLGLKSEIKNAEMQSWGWSTILIMIKATFSLSSQPSSQLPSSQSVLISHLSGILILNVLSLVFLVPTRWSSDLISHLASIPAWLHLNSPQ